MSIEKNTCRRWAFVRLIGHTHATTEHTAAANRKGLSQRNVKFRVLDLLVQVHIKRTGKSFLTKNLLDGRLKYGRPCLIQICFGLVSIREEIRILKGPH